MPIDCTGNLTADIVFDCANAPVAGIEQNVVLIKKEDIDYINTATSTDSRVVIDNLQLKPGTTGYLLTGVKQSNGKAWELVKKENAPDKFKHTFSGVIFNPTASNKEQANQLAMGAKYVVVIEQVWKGEANKDAFEILGLTSGLELSTMTNNSKENDNMIMFELASVDGYEEVTMPQTLLDVDYAATKTAFNNKFAQAAG
ncbi:hypothetical protein GN157_00095 [Flavobacterium rakeshii]|uniref:Uncharacterized protein n=1 Tax=Flavobacterium rakeshii TaxID=1038845 RepID=A0A6N8HCR8_9FLAO|nr:hypothetical protein [Flavobacterium rakeshii]MUV02097.1 hypothetical protein [Flavobacterium rakeshii]